MGGILKVEIERLETSLAEFVGNLHSEYGLADVWLTKQTRHLALVPETMPQVDWRQWAYCHCWEFLRAERLAYFVIWFRVVFQLGIHATDEFFGDSFDFHDIIFLSFWSKGNEMGLRETILKKSRMRFLRGEFFNA